MKKCWWIDLYGCSICRKLEVIFDDEGDAQVSMAIFAYAQGNQPDTSRDPYKYGDDTGLKQQKVTIKKYRICQILLFEA